MERDPATAKTLLEMACSIVETQVKNQVMQTKEICESLTRIYQVLAELCNSEASADKKNEEECPDQLAALRKYPRSAIQGNEVVCLECGKAFKQITTKHLRVHHGMTLREYKKKWGYRLGRSLSCNSLMVRRSRSAAMRGIPEGLRRYQEERRMAKKE